MDSFIKRNNKWKKNCRIPRIHVTSKTSCNGFRTLFVGEPSMGVCSSNIFNEEAKQERISQFIFFATHGDIERVLEAIDGGIDVNSRDSFGMTALLWASYTGQLGTIKVLLANKSNSQIKDHNGRNALHHAARRNQTEVARYLVKHAKLEVNSVSSNGDTALHKAARSGHLEVSKALVQLGADINKRNSQLLSPIEELKKDLGLSSNNNDGEKSNNSNSDNDNQEKEIEKNTSQGDSKDITTSKGGPNKKLLGAAKKVIQSTRLSRKQDTEFKRRLILDCLTGDIQKLNESDSHVE